MQRIGWVLQENLYLLKSIIVPSTAFVDVYNLSGDGRRCYTMLILRKYVAL